MDRVRSSTSAPPKEPVDAGAELRVRSEHRHFQRDCFGQRRHLTRRRRHDGHDALVGRLGDVQPRYLIAAGSIIASFAMVDLLRMTPDADFWFFAWSRIYLGIGLPLIFIPITTASYEGLPPSKTDQASALINLARNFGGSMGVSLSQTVLARREQFHQERLAENVGSWNPFYYDTINRIEAYFRTHTFTGSSAGASTAYVGQLVQSQAAILAYIDVFFALAVVAGIMVLLSLSLRSVGRGTVGTRPS